MDDRRRDGGTNFILRIKEEETRLTLHEHNDDEDDDKSRGIGQFPAEFIPTRNKLVHSEIQ